MDAMATSRIYRVMGSIETVRQEAASLPGLFLLCLLRMLTA
jgi:hypothetical protein